MNRFALAHRKAHVLFKSLGNRQQEQLTLLNVAVGYLLNNQLDSAQILMQHIFPQIMATGTADNKGFLLMEWGSLQFERGNHQSALAYLKKTIPIFQPLGNLRRLATIYTGLGHFYNRLNQPDSAIYYAQKGLAAATKLGFKREILGASQLLAKLYEPKDPAKALYYLKIATAHRGVGGLGLRFG